MLRNYIKISLRSLLKNRLNTGINMLGLAMGIACFLLIGLFIEDELSYDRFYANADRIFRVTVENFNEDGEKVRHWVAASPGFVPLLVQDYGVVEAGTRLYLWDNPVLIHQGKKIIEEELIYAEPDFFKIFDFEFIEGDPVQVFEKPNSIVLTEAAAERYFTSNWRDQSILGKTISYQDEFDLTVTGIIKNVPEQSHLQFEVVVTFQTIIDLYGGEESVQTTIGIF